MGRNFTNEKIEIDKRYSKVKFEKLICGGEHANCPYCNFFTNYCKLFNVTLKRTPANDNAGYDFLRCGSCLKNIKKAI